MHPVSIIYGALNAIACQLRPLRARRAKFVSGTEEKRTRTRNKVVVSSKGGLDLPLSEILDYARMRFSSAHNRGSERTGLRASVKISPACPYSWAGTACYNSGFSKY
jgi:hypothetical protein